MDKFKIFDICSLIIGFFFKRKNEIPVIYYHSIVEGDGSSYANTNIDVFKSHMSYLEENNYTTLRFDEVNTDFKKSKHDKSVVIAFDDGFKDNYELIFEYMKEHKLKYNIFLIGNKIDVDYDYLTWEQVETMSKSGLVGFGAHTYTHIDSRKINSSNADCELNKTDMLIQSHTGKTVTDFCFPYGYYNQQTMVFFAENSDYTKIYTSNYMPIKKINNHTFKGRIPIRNNDSVEVLKHKLKGYYNFLYYFKYKKEVK